MGVHIEQIDPFNDAAADAPGTPRCVAADMHGREEFATPWQLAESPARRTVPSQRDRVKALYAGFEDGAGGRRG